MNFCVTEKVSKENLDAVLYVVSGLKGSDVIPSKQGESKNLLTREDQK